MACLGESLPCTLHFLPHKNVLTIDQQSSRLRHWARLSINEKEFCYVYIYIGNFFIIIILSAYKQLHLQIPSLPKILALENGQSFCNVLPTLLTCYEVLYGRCNLVFASSHLLGGISVSESESTVFYRLKINGNPEWSSQLVVSRVPLANTCRGIIYTV